MANKIKFKIKSDKISDFVDKISDLTKIGDSIKLKIDNKNILMYSMIGGNVILAFKNYIIDTKEYLEYDEFEYKTLDIVISNAGKFVKNLNFIKTAEKVTMDVSFKASSEDGEIMNARSVQIVGGKLKINWLGAEQYEVKDITKEQLDQRLNLKGRKWSFVISKADFSDIKKLSSINGERIISISVVGGKVVLSENAAWELEVDQLDKDRNSNLILNKKFLSCIDDSQDQVEFNIFENFMLIKGDNTNLMLSFEQDFSDQD
jgi:hypothetical protein